MADPRGGLGGNGWPLRRSALGTVVLTSRSAEPTIDDAEDATDDAAPSSAAAGDPASRPPRRRFRTVSHWDSSALAADEAALSLLLTCFVIVLLGAGTMAFTEDTRRLVIDPIERMMRRVNEISDDPLSAGTGTGAGTGAGPGDDEGLETTFLLRTIDKIGHLMRIGFGEAGAQIIAANLRDGTGGALRLDRVLAGRAIVSVFGFCDIRNFTDTTECLQEEVMTFVNRVAHLLHHVVKDCGGAANKNIGDAFLLSWKVSPSLALSHTLPPPDHQSLHLLLVLLLLFAPF